MVTFSNLWNNLPDIRSLLPQKLGGRTAITAVEASPPEKLQSLRETLEPLTCGAAWQSDNNWSELTKIQKSLEYLQDKPSLISTSSLEALNAQFESIRGGDITALPNVQVLFTNLQQAKSHLNERDTSETRFQVELAKYKLEQQRNNPLGGTTNEERRYANLINARNQLRFEIQLYAPTITDYKTLLAPEAKVPYPLQGPVQNYKNALEQHADEVMVWVRRENRSSVQLLDQAQYEKNQENRDPFIWEGRAEVLQGRVELINSHIVQQFDTFFTTYQQVMNSAFDTTCKELFPDRFEKGFLNAIVRHIIWAWETVFGSSDTENRESKMALARLLNAEGAEEKPQTSSEVDRILYTAQVLTNHLAKDSADTLKEARNSFNSSVRDVLAGESLAHYFPETVSTERAERPYTTIR